ncbi:wall-associated receptor kinase 1-like [Magnolia sinica]|uniref:wall-associated receptor kinase 1-like n=1 Tax=Magnolia sinica TaxID=86752 RepID=UPI00265A61BC|nr:wall-associated receptor kinase 1-like [Magnolia sinica]
MVALFCFFIFLPLTHLSSTNARAIDSISIADCPKKCGNINISYPFGMGYSHCFVKGFEVNCSQDIPYVSDSNLQLLEILQAEVRINSTEFIAKSCPSSQDEKSTQIQLSEASPFTISAASNDLIVIGCTTIGKGMTLGDYEYWCTSKCPTHNSVVSGSCKGQGCCEILLPYMRKMLQISVYQTNSGISACSYGFFVEDGSYIFTESDLLDFDKKANISMRLEWSMEGRCFSPRGAPAHTCGGNSSCAETSNRYQCNCSDGYRGNPYLNGSQGCQGSKHQAEELEPALREDISLWIFLYYLLLSPRQSFDFTVFAMAENTDIDECDEPFSGSPCMEGAKCRNTVPGFVCECPAGTVGEGRKSGIGCRREHESTQVLNPIPTVLIGQTIVTIHSAFS